MVQSSLRGPVRIMRYRVDPWNHEVRRSGTYRRHKPGASHILTLDRADLRNLLKPGDLFFGPPDKLLLMTLGGRTFDRLSQVLMKVAVSANNVSQEASAH